MWETSKIKLIIKRNITKNLTFKLDLLYHLVTLEIKRNKRLLFWRGKGTHIHWGGTKVIPPFRHIDSHYGALSSTRHRSSTATALSRQRRSTFDFSPGFQRIFHIKKHLPFLSLAQSTGDKWFLISEMCRGYISSLLNLYQDFSCPQTHTAIF